MHSTRAQDCSRPKRSKRKRWYFVYGRTTRCNLWRLRNPLGTPGTIHWCEVSKAHCHTVWLFSSLFESCLPMPRKFVYSQRILLQFRLLMTSRMMAIARPPNLVCRSPRLAWFSTIEFLACPASLIKTGQAKITTAQSIVDSAVGSKTFLTLLAAQPALILCESPQAKQLKLEKMRLQVYWHLSRRSLRFWI